MNLLMDLLSKRRSPNQSGGTFLDYISKYRSTTPKVRLSNVSSTQQTGTAQTGSTKPAGTTQSSATQSGSTQQAWAYPSASSFLASLSTKPAGATQSGATQSGTTQSSATQSGSTQQAGTSQSGDSTNRTAQQQAGASQSRSPFMDLIFGNSSSAPQAGAPQSGTTQQAGTSQSGTSQPRSGYSSTVDAYGNVYVPGLGTVTPTDIYNWVNETGDPYAIAQAIQQYGVDPVHVVDAYNLEAKRRGKPTVSYADSEAFLGIPVRPDRQHTGPSQSTYSSTVDAYGNVYVPGLGTYTPAQIYDWVNETGDPNAIAQAIQQYGVDPVHIVDAYNLEAKKRGKPTVSYADAEAFLGIPVRPNSSGQGGSIDIPLDVYPTSQSGSTSSQSSSSYSGINWSGPVASQVLPEISSQIDAITQLPSTVGQQAVDLAAQYAAQQNEMIDQLLQGISTAYASGDEALQQAMQSAAQGVQQAYGTADELERAARYAARQAAQSNYGLNSVLQQLNAIGMLDSTTGANVMSQALGEVLRGLSQQAYQASVQGQQAIQDALRAQAQVASGVGAAYAPLGQMLTGGYGTAGSMADQAAQRQLQAQEFVANLVGSLIPQALAALAGLDKYSSSQYEGTSSSYSTSSDPLAPYRLLVDMMGLMS